VSEGVVAFLQNAWSPHYAGREWPRPSWLRALERSRSGKRLARLKLPWEAYHNMTAEVGATPDSVKYADPYHVRRVLAARGPGLVLALGGLPEACLRFEWEGPLLVLPHPASRTLTNALLDRAAGMVMAGVETWTHDRLALRQRRGHSELEVL